MQECVYYQKPLTAPRNTAKYRRTLIFTRGAGEASGVHNWAIGIDTTVTIWVVVRVILTPSGYLAKFNTTSLVNLRWRSQGCSQAKSFGKCGKKQKSYESKKHCCFRAVIPIPVMVQSTSCAEATENKVARRKTIEQEGHSIFLRATWLQLLNTTGF